jgi:hypothetical protein
MSQKSLLCNECVMFDLEGKFLAIYFILKYVKTFIISLNKLYTENIYVICVFDLMTFFSLSHVTS